MLPLMGTLAPAKVQLLALLLRQVRVSVRPARTIRGFDVKEIIVGNGPGGITLTVSDFDTCPERLPHVSV